MRLVPVKFLKENSCIASNIINSDGRLMLKEGQKITSYGIQTLNNLGVSYVYIYDEHCFNHNSNKYTTKIEHIYHYMVELRAIAYKVIDGNSGITDIQNATHIATKIVEDILLLPDEFKITYEPNKLILNSDIERIIYVAIMSTVLGSKMQLGKDKLVKLCLTALLKDVALFSPKITESNPDLYKLHPLIAYKYLKETYNLDEEILKGILQHHEYYDGSGFPNKLSGKNICTFARIISMVDCFYEVKSNHDLLLDNELMFEVKLKKILQKFDIEMINYFIKHAEIFTPDTIIRLNTNDIGVIIKNGELNPFRPIIKIIKGDTYSDGDIIDLQQHTNLAIKRIDYYVEN